MLSKKATLYIGGVIVLGAALSLTSQLRIEWRAASSELLVAMVMVALAAASLFGKVVFMSRADARNATSWYTPLLGILFAGSLVLSPQMIVALVAFPHVVEWLLERARKTPFLRSWYIQPFNFATHLVCSLAAWGTYVAAHSHMSMPVAAIVAAFVYLTVNHYLVGQVLVLACKMRWVESGVLNAKNLAADGAFLVAGIGTAALIHVSPVIAIPIVLLLILAQRQLARALVHSAAQTQPARA